MKRSTKTLVAVTVVTAALVAGTSPAMAGGPTEKPGVSDAEVDRLLVFSIPHVTWDALQAADTPNLDAVLEDAAVADLAVRVLRRKTEPATGYTTIGAGTRAGGTGDSGLALGPEETFEGGPALESYQRRMGHDTDASVLMLGIPDVLRRNDRLLFDAEIGALGDALADASVGRAVIGNADRDNVETGSSFYDRQLASALMDSEGRVGGRVDRGLLVEDPSAPFGLRLDHGAVEDAFVDAWRDRSVVLVEASDITRAESYRHFVRSSLRDPLTKAAIEDGDELAGRLLEHVDLERDGVLVVSPASPRGDPELTVVGLRTPGTEGSLLGSSTTRRDGFVTIYDVGAGIVKLMGVERPASMEGRPLEPGRVEGDYSARVSYLSDENEEAQFRDATVGLMFALFVALQLALSFVAMLVLRFRRLDRARVPVAAAALVILGILPMTYFAGFIKFSDIGLAGYLTFLFAGAAVLAAIAWLLGRRDPVASVGWVLVVVVGVIVGSAALSNSELMLSTVFGDSPIVAGRFTGINNLTFAQLAAAGIVLAVLLAHRIGGRRGAMAAAALLGFVLVVDGLPAWGADVGGVLTAVPAFAYVGYRLFGARIRVRTVALFALVTVVVIGAFVAYDLAQPSEQRSHLGRLVEQIDAQGSDALVTVVVRKAAANLRVITSSVWLLMVPGALGFAAYLLWRRPRLVSVIEHRIPSISIVLAGLMIAGVLGFALNDSGIAVPGMVLGVLNPVLVHLSMRLQDDRKGELPPPRIRAALRFRRGAPEPAPST